MATNIYSVAISYNCAGQFAQNILHYQFDDSGYGSTAGAADALLTAWDTANRTKLKNLLPTATTLVSMRARSVTQPGGFESFFGFPAGQTGARTGAVAASGIGPCIVLVPIGNAKVRGRVFLPGITDSDAVDGEYSTGYLTAYSTNENLFRNSLVLGGGGTPTALPVIFTRKPVKVGTQIAHTGLTPYPATQRRRQRPA